MAAQNRHKSTVGGTGDRCDDAGLIRRLRCADHDRAPRPLRTRCHRSTNQPRRHCGQKSRDLKISRHAPNGRRERSTWRRWAHPWAAPRRSRPRTPTSRTQRRRSTNQPRFHRDRKFEKSRDPEFSWHAPNSRRDRLTECSTGVQVCPLTKIWASRYRDFSRPRLEFVLELY